MSELFAIPFSGSPERQSFNIAHQRSPSLLCSTTLEQRKSSLALQRIPVPAYHMPAEGQRSSVTYQRSPAHVYGTSMKRQQPSTAFLRSPMASYAPPSESQQSGFAFHRSPIYGYQTLERRKSSFAHCAAPGNTTRTPMRPTPTGYNQQRQRPYQTPTSAYPRSAQPNFACPTSAYPRPTIPRLHPHPQPKHRAQRQQFRQQQSSEPRYSPLPPFLPPRIPSKLILHDCPTMQRQLIQRPSLPPSSNPSTPRFGSPPSRPLTTLLMNLPLASKISQALKLSREIQALLYRAAQGLLPESKFHDQIEELEKRQGSIREEIEVELEATWIGAGLLSPPLPPDAGHTMDAKTECAATPASSFERSVSHDTIDRSLKRKFEEEEGAKASGACPNVKHHKPSPSVYLPHRWSAMPPKGEQDFEQEEEGLSHMPVTPIGIMQAMIPLTRAESVRMSGWTWAGAMSRMGLRRMVREDSREMEEGLLSPKGSGLDMVST